MSKGLCNCAKLVNADIIRIAVKQAENRCLNLESIVSFDFVNKNCLAKNMIKF